MWAISPLAGYGGVSSLSLRDLMDAPEQAFQQIESNLRNNWVELLVASTIFTASAKFGKRALRGPINNANRLLFTGKNAPLRGMGIRI